MSNKWRGLLGRRPLTSDEIRLGIGEAITVAMRKHKAAGVPAVVWQDGKVVLIAPQDIVIPDDDDSDSDPTDPGKTSDSN
jgi:hypothetical protein